MFLNFVLIIGGATVAVYLFVKNVQNSFQPPIRSKIELFVAGFLVAFSGGWIVIPEPGPRMVLCIIGGIVFGLNSMYIVPRRWEYINNKQKDRK